MSNEHTGQTNLITKQQNRNQDCEVSNEPKDNLNTLPLVDDHSKKIELQDEQKVLSQKKHQQGQKCSQKKQGMDQITQNISHDKNVIDQNTSSMIKIQKPNLQSQASAHNKYFQSKAQMDSNDQVQLQASGVINIISLSNQGQVQKKKLEQCIKIQEYKRLEIQNTTIMEQKQKLNEKLAQAERQISNLQQKHKEEIQKLRIDVNNKDQKLQELEKRVSQYNLELLKVTKELKQTNRTLEIQKQVIRQAQIDKKQFYSQNEELKSKLSQLQLQLGQEKTKNQQYSEKILQINQEIKKLTEQKQTYIKKNKQYQTQLHRLTSNNTALRSEINNLQQQITKDKSQLSEKNNQITILTEKNMLLQSFKDFKLKQECQLSNLAQLINNRSQKNCNQLKEYVAKFKKKMKQYLQSIKQQIDSDYTNNQQNLLLIQNQYEKKLKQIQQICKDSTQGLQKEKKILDQQYQELRQQLQQLQKTSAQMLKRSYSQINSLQQELTQLRSYFNEAEQKHQQQKYEMMKTICQYSQQIISLRTQIQINDIIKTEFDFKQQNAANWLSDKYQSIVTQFDDYKYQKEKQISQLQMQLSNLKKQLRENAEQAQKRQKRIIDSLGQFYTASQKQKDQVYDYTDRNKNILIEDLNKLLVINQNVYDSKMMLKTSQLKQLAQNYCQLESEFQKYKKQTVEEISMLCTERYQLQSKLLQTELVKQSKIMIENEFTSKEDILNNIIFILDSKKNFNLGDLIDQFQDQDTKGEFRSLIEILISANRRTQQSEQQYCKFRERLNQINANYSVLQRQRNEAYARNQELERLLQIKEKILNQEKNNYVLKSTQQLQLVLNLQGKQVEISQLKKRVDQLINHNQKLVQDIQQLNKFNERQKQNITELTDEIKRMKFDKTSRNSADNRNILNQMFKKNEEEIQRYKKDIRIRTQECIKSKQLIEQLQYDVQKERKLAQQYKEKLQIAQKKNRQTSKSIVSQRQYRSLQQQLASNIEKINQLNSEFTKKKKELEDAKQTIKKYQLQLKSQKQKEPRHNMMSPTVFSSSQSKKIIENSKSPLKFELKDSRSKSNILEFDQKLFSVSDILVMTEDENFIKNTIQNFTGKICVSAQLKFKMQAAKSDFLNEAKNALSFINTGNLIWIFKKQSEVFGAISFNKEINSQQSALLFNLSKKKVIYPANMKSSWVPVKSDSFYLYFGVQQAKYIWKSKIFSVSESKSIKYFEQNTPLVGNFVSKQKIEVEQFQIFLLNIKK